MRARALCHLALLAAATHAMDLSAYPEFANLMQGGMDVGTLGMDRQDAKDRAMLLNVCSICEATCVHGTTILPDRACQQRLSALRSDSRFRAERIKRRRHSPS